MQKTLVLTIILAFFIAGCTHSPTPNAKNFIKNEQNLFQAAHHWDLLAEQQAENIIKTVSQSSNIYVTSRENDSAFGQAFYNLLISKLVSKGAIVVTEPANNIPTFSYKVQIVTRQKNNPAAWDLSEVTDWIFLNREAREQKIEVIITTMGKKNNVLLMSDSQLFYIFPENFYNYKDKITEAYRVFPVTNK